MAAVNKIRQGTKWLLTGTIGSKIFQFGFGVVLARILFPADFGMMVTIQIFTGLAGYFSGAGMGQALVQAKAVKKEDYNIVFTVQLVIGISLYCLFYFIAPWFSVFFEDSLYMPLLRVAALSFLWRPFMAIQMAFLQREMRFKEISIVRVITGVISGVITIGLAVSGKGVWSLILGGMIGTIIQIFILFWVTRWKPAIRFEAEVAKRLGIYGFKVSANSILGYFGAQIDNLFVSRILGAQPLGLYNKGFSLSEIPREIMSKSTYNVLFRALSKEQDNLDMNRYIYFRSVTLLVAYTAPVFIGLWWVADPFIEVVYGTRWLGAVPVLKILVLIGLFRCVGNVSGAVIEAQNRLGQEFFIFLQAIIILGIGCYFFAAKGIIYVAWVVFAKSLYSTLRICFLACKIIDGKLSDLLKAIMPGLLLSGIMVVFLFLLDQAVPLIFNSINKPLYLFVTVLFGAVVYSTSFLFIPIPSLISETEKWKKKLKLI